MSMTRDTDTNPNPFVTQEIEKIHSEMSNKASWKKNKNYFSQSVIRLREETNNEDDQK